MKRYFLLYSVIVLFFLYVIPIGAQTSYSELYISITDALMETKLGNEEEAKRAVEQFANDWAKVTSEKTEAKNAVDVALQNVQQAASNTERQTALTELSKALATLDQLENPVDQEAERKNFEKKFTPIMTTFEQALETEDIETIQEAYRQFNIKWNQYEAPVRSQSIGLYGQIETQMSFIRIALASEQVDLASIKSQYASLKASIEQFIAGEDVTVEAGDYSLQTLIDFIKEAKENINDGEFAQASEALKQFIIVWPNVEIEISTKNSKLYTELENEMPILVSELMKAEPNSEQVLQDLTYYETEIGLLQDHSNYSFWDSAMILLREGLEALLIIMVLVSFLKKSNQQSMTKWIYVGAGAGVFLSIAAAIAFSMMFQSLTANTSREMVEGYVGIVAAMMMVGVGIWLHRKSSVQSWNAYLSKQIGHAISKQSMFAMALISFLSVFREGAETILFYTGIAPNMPTFDFVLGIIIAIAILCVVGFFMFVLSLRIPVHLFFIAATIFIYLLALKMTGSSIHTLQLTNVMPTSVIHELPIVSSLGFYPTIETIVAQSILLVIFVVVALQQRRNENRSQVSTVSSNE